jgi:hypothetical protein
VATDETAALRPLLLALWLVCGGGGAFAGFVLAARPLWLEQIARAHDAFGRDALEA